MTSTKDYQGFLDAKIKLAPKNGFDIDPSEVNPVLKPHQRDIVLWSIKGGCRAVFASFGLGKTVMQLETVRLIQKHKGGNVLIVCPLGVRNEFSRDGRNLVGIDRIKYITSTDEIEPGQHFYITNYERVRMGGIDPSCFTAVTMDEASILRSLSSETTDMLMHTFKVVPFRFVHTATPSPNRFLQLTHYADYLGIMDRGQILTRFFQRDSTTAGNLTIYEKRKQEFWYWMSSWAVFVTKPSDLGYDNTGYDLPPITIHRHLVQFERELKVDRKTGQTGFVPDSSKSLPDAAKEKRESLPYRIQKAVDIIQQDPDDNFLIWHHQEAERHAIQKALGKDCKSVYGSQKMDEREDYLIGFSEGRYQYLSTKPSIAGSGCNFQHHCHHAVFVGINYEFNDFIQAVHRIYRFMQDKPVQVHIIYTDAEEEILKTLEQKWANHTTLQNEMTDIIQQYGLNSDLYQMQLKRQMFTGRQEARGDSWHFVNNDCVEEFKLLDDCSIDMIVSSIPFGNHYEYSENYNCFGHNEDNEAFFEQMDFLIPDLYRTLKPGRIAAIHVKDRIRYSYMNGTDCFTTIDPFSDDTVRSFRKHGFHLLSRITVTTDVVQENNQTYRLGWTEACKDHTKMGNGLPEYVLIFRKIPSNTNNAYADVPVVHDKTKYTRAQWQLDAHAYWKTDNDRLPSTELLRRLDLSDVLKIWKQLESEGQYGYRDHIELCERLESIGKLPSTFMAIPPQSNANPHVWDDITRMRTLNTDQARRNLTKHICPLQLDLIERLIERYTNPGELVADPFGGIGSVPYQAVKMGRKGYGTELNSEYFADGIKHLRAAEEKQNVLTLFDLFDAPKTEPAVAVFA